MSPMNNRLLVPRKVPGLLDLVPGAAAAYSLRSLSNSYADPVVTVRRSSDDAEEDFTAAEVDDGTLAAFCGAGDGFVKQWWDQSGNARHASQSTSGAQPQIVDAGVVILKEGKPAIEFDGVDDRLAGSPIGINALTRKLSVACLKAGMHVQVRSVGNGNNLELQETNISFFTAGSAYNSGSFAAEDTMLLTAAINSPTTFESFINGAASQSETGIGPTDDAFASNINIGFRETDAGTAQQKAAGSVAELVFWGTLESLNLRAAEGNIAWSYSV